MQNTLAVALGAALVTLGSGALVAPAWSARQYGLPTTNPTALAYVKAVGARDIALGGALLANRENRPALAAICYWATVAAVVDALAVGSVHGWRPQHAIHLSGAVAMLFAGFTFGEPRPDDI